MSAPAGDASTPAPTSSASGDATESPRRLWFPFAIGTYLVLVEWAERTGATSRALADLAGSVALALLTAGLSWLLASRLTRDRDRRALIALIGVLWAGLFLSFQSLVYLYVSERAGSPEYATPAWTLLLASLAFAVSRGRGSLATVTRMLNVASLVLLALGVSSVIAGSRGPNPAELAERQDVVVRDQRSPERPDIYVLVLDKYTSGAWLEATYGLEHRPFEDSLRALGFAVPRRVPAPYAHTLLSVTALLEGRYLHPFPDDMEWDRLVERIEGARLWPRLQELGYRYAFVPSTFGASRNSTSPDIILKAPAAAHALPGETWWVNSPLWRVGPIICRLTACDQSLMMLTPYPIEHAQELHWKLDALESLPDSAGPIVAFAHILTPHEPFLFEDDCSPARPWWPTSDVEPGLDGRIRAAYALQVHCLDRLLLATITRILERTAARSAVPPVILLQGDHGHGRLATDVMRGRTLDLDELSDDQVGERMSVFAAYKFPGAADAVADETSPVNALRLAIGGIIGDRGALLPSRAFWSSYQDPFAFTEVPLSRLRPRDPAGR